MTPNNEINRENCTSTALGANGTWAGEWSTCLMFSSIVVSLKTDKAGILYLDFSPDKTNVDSTLTFNIAATTNEVHRVSVTRAFFRIRYANDSVAQTYFRLGTILSNTYALTSPLNSVVQQDSDAQTVKAIDSEISIAGGLFDGYSIVNKFGTNATIDQATVPEDIWEAGGVYTGFPDTTLETISVLSSSTDDTAAGTGARTVTMTGLDSNYDVISETITLNGTTPVASVNQYRRLHTANVSSAGSGGVNVGTITFRHTTTTTNVFLSMIAGRNQTNSSGYTVPAGYTAYMRCINCSIRGNVNSAVDGFIWTRAFGRPFRSRRPFSASSSYRLYDIIYGGLVFTEKSDMVLRIGLTSANNTSVSGGYDLLLVRN